MSYRIVVVDDSAADTSYITSLVNDWANSRAEAAADYPRPGDELRAAGGDLQL